MKNKLDTIRAPGHFIGDHPGIDLTNPASTRHAPHADNDLLNSPPDVGHRLHFAEPAARAQANVVSDVPNPGFLRSVRELREASFSVFNALAAGKPPSTERLGLLLERAAEGLSKGGRLKLIESESTPQIVRFDDPKATVAFLAAVSLEAYFVLPGRGCMRALGVAGFSSTHHEAGNGAGAACLEWGRLPTGSFWVRKPNDAIGKGI